MIIYRDLISHDEMFSDIYKIREIADGLCLEVEGKMVSRTEGNIDDSLIGGNASAEGPEGEGTESTVITGVDIVMNHHLQETSFTKEAYKKYIKDYMKSNKFGNYFGSITCHHNWLLLVIHTTPGLKTNGTDVILSSSFILTVIYLEWRHCF
uniref:Translationally-controlled tumor protein n=1 Tax=Pongo abelii TaxID=9601 RepID=A0A8I5TKH1_PONAB